jgi:hypothetical protein
MQQRGLEQLDFLEWLKGAKAEKQSRHVKGRYSFAKEWMRRFDKPLRTLNALHLAIASSEGLRISCLSEAPTPFLIKFR